MLAANLSALNPAKVGIARSVIREDKPLADSAVAGVSGGEGMVCWLLRRVG